MLAGSGTRPSFPSRPIEIVCFWSAGGGTDRIARQLAMQLERRLGMPVNVVNATGGSGVVGFARAADFAPLALLNQDAAAIFVRHDSSHITLADLEARIRERRGRLKAGGSAQGRRVGARPAGRRRGPSGMQRSSAGSMTGGCQATP